MDITAQYIAVWKKINRKSRASVNLSDIKLTEEIHQCITPEMEEKISAQVPTKKISKEAWTSLINKASYSVVVRKDGEGYSLLAGHVGYEMLKRMNIKVAKIFVAEATDRDSWLEELRNTITLTPIVNIDEIESAAKKDTDPAVKKEVEYLVKHKDFKEPIMIEVDPVGSIKVKSGAAGITAAKLLGLKQVKTTLAL